MQRFLEEARANAGPAMPGIDQNHRNPGKGSTVSNRGDGADHIAFMIECDTTPRRTHGEESLPINRELIPSACPAEAESGGDVGSGHHPQQHARILERFTLTVNDRRTAHHVMTILVRTILWMAITRRTA
jgi:hypothetical protein